MKEYNFEENKEVDISNLTADFVPLDIYSSAHKSLPIVCHDVLIEYKNKFLLVKRDNPPLKNALCVIGGRVLRGIPIEQSLIRKVKKECNLSLTNIEFLGVARTFFKTDPFGHGKGTDTINLMFYAQGEGDLKLDSLHKQPILFRKEDYTNEFKKGLHPYVQEIIDKSFNLLHR